MDVIRPNWRIEFEKCGLGMIVAVLLVIAAVFVRPLPTVAGIAGPGGRRWAESSEPWQCLRPIVHRHHRSRHLRRTDRERQPDYLVGHRLLRVAGRICASDHRVARHWRCRARDRGHPYYQHVADHQDGTQQWGELLRGSTTPAKTEKRTSAKKTSPKRLQRHKATGKKGLQSARR